MIIEVIGPTGAGKSTLTRLLAGRLGPGQAVIASDLVLDRPVLRHVRNATAANLVQEVWGLPYLLRALPRHARLLRLSAGMLVKHSPSRLDLVMDARSVLRRTGIHELARARGHGRVVLIDEGVVLIAYQLFVYSTAEPTAAAVERFAASLALPDRVIYVRSPVSVLTGRAISRPDPPRQLAGLTAGQAEEPLQRALTVFDQLVSTRPLRDRTVAVDNASPDLDELDRLAADLAVAVRSWKASENGALTSSADTR